MLADGTLLKLTVAAAAVGGFIFCANLNDPPNTRSRIARVRSDHRSLATAIETYFVDNKAYPPSTLDVTQTPMRDLAREHPKATWKIPHFTHLITTPVAYVTSIFPDPFVRERGRAFQYHVDPSGEGWITWSAGPDGIYNLDWKVYDATIPQPSPQLLTGSGPHGAYTFDPTNGSVSAGDLWRVKQ